MIMRLTFYLLTTLLLTTSISLFAQDERTITVCQNFKYLIDDLLEPSLNENSDNPCYAINRTIQPSGGILDYGNGYFIMRTIGDRTYTITSQRVSSTDVSDCDAGPPTQQTVKINVVSFDVCFDKPEPEVDPSFDQIFQDHPYLIDIVNPNTCSNLQITVYKTSFNDIVYLIETEFYKALYGNKSTFLEIEKPDGPDLGSTYGFAQVLDSWTCPNSSTIEGCTDASACNYNSKAIVEDNSCFYASSNCFGECYPRADLAAYGCTDPQATNYTPTAICDDGSCKFDGESSVFVRYPWLLDYIDSDNCNGDKVTVFSNLARYELKVETQDATYVFLADSEALCEPADSIIGLNCETYISTAKEDKVVETWECGGNATSDITIVDELRSKWYLQYYSLANNQYGESLTDDGVYTVFAPTNDALESAYPDIVSYTFEIYGPSDPPSDFSNTINNHIVEGSYLSTDLFDGQILTSISGIKLIVSISNGEILINDTKIQTADYETTNGVVHIVDAVLQPSAEPETTQTVYDVIVESEDHTTLEAAIIAADLEETLTGEQNFTVFAPTDAAFAALPEGTLEALLADPTGELSQILLYHVLGFSFQSKFFTEQKILETVNGAVFIVTVNDNGTFINDAKVTVTDIVASNGVVHVIDAVLLPSEGPETTDLNIIEVLSNTGVHYALTSALITAGLIETLSGEGSFTIFAPIDMSVGSLPIENGFTILTSDGDGDLRDVLLYHVLDGQITSTSLSNGQSIATLNGANIEVSINENAIFINDAQVTTPDIVASNGVIHVIDSYLLPPGFSFDPPPVFETYDWLSTVVDQDNCSNTKVTVYASGISRYVFIEGPNGQTLYTDFGAPFCTTNSEISCADAYDLNITPIVTSWTCPDFVEPARQTVVDVIVESEVHTSLENAVITAGLAETLSGEGPFTVFAPTDDAFRALPPASLGALFVNTSSGLTDLLLYHVLEGTILSSDLSDGQIASTLNGADIKVRITDEGVLINDALVTVADIVTDNGVVHVIDAVLLPPPPEQATVFDIIANSVEHNILKESIKSADLSETLSGEGPFTVFAPTDEAFVAMPPDVLTTLLSDPSGDLTDILLYHVLGAEALSTSLTDKQTAITINGAEITVTINDLGIFINDAKVTVADIVGINGVVHVIDAVLIPSSEPTPRRTVADVIIESEDHNTLEELLITVDLVETLSGEGPFTVFAPTDAAFAALPNGTGGDIAELLLYHVLGAEVQSTSLTNQQTATTLNGADIKVTIDDNGIFINDAKVTVADIITDNGVVHVIDAVLLPSTLPEQPVDDQIFETYTWLSNVLNPVTCTNEKITVYQTGIYQYVYIESSSGGTLYADNGLLYCTSSSNLSCIDFYRLSTIVDQWTCSGGVELTKTTVVDVIIESEVHETLEAAVIAAGLAETLSGEGPFTVFAPTDNAFASLPEGTVEALLADPKGDLAQILLYHVLGAQVISTSLTDRQTASTLNGAGIKVTIDDRGIFINDAKVTIADIVTDNGVVHVIDAVLLPSTQPEQTDDAPIFETYNWLSSVVSPATCTNEKITVYQTGIYQYVYIESASGGTLYNDIGLLYCTSSSNLSCVNFYRLSNIVDSWTCADGGVTPPPTSGELPEEIKAFEWLNNSIDFNNCAGSSIEVYDFGGYSFVYVTQNGSSTMYLNDGTYYCASSTAYNCKTLYGINRTADFVWNCSGVNKTGNEAMVINREKQVTEIFDFQLYPNPTNGIFYVEFLTDKIQQVNVYDMMGKPVLNQSLHNETSSQISFDLSYQPKGLYMVELLGEKIRSIEKLIIE